MNYLQRKKYALKKATNFKGYLNSMSGFNPLTVPNGMNENILNLTITGNSYNDYEEGDNCLDVLDVWDNPTGTFYSQYKFKYIKLKPNTSYTLSTNAPQTTIAAGSNAGLSTSLIRISSGKRTTTWYWQNNHITQVYTDNPKTWCTDADGYLTVMLMYEKGNINLTRDDLINETYWVMLNEGETALEYKPYEGLLSSTNPHEFQSCGNNNENLLDISNISMDVSKSVHRDAEGWITMSYDNTGNSSEKYALAVYPKVSEKILPNTKYVLLVEFSEITNGFLRTSTDDGSSKPQFNVYRDFKRDAIITVSSREDFANVTCAWRLFLMASPNSIAKIKFRIAVFLYNEGIANKFSYIPYGNKYYIIPIKQSGNLYNVQDRTENQNKASHWSVDEEDYITIEIDNSSGTGTKYPSYFTKPSGKIKPNTLYTIFTEIKEIIGIKCLQTTTAVGTQGQFRSITTYTSGGTYKTTLVSGEDLTSCATMLRTETPIDVGKTGKVTFRISLFEGENPTSAEDFVYSPYRDNFNTVNIYTPEPIMGGISGSSDADRFGDDIVIDIKNRRATLIKKFKKVVIDTEVVNVKYGSSSGGISSYNYFWNTNEYSTLRNVCNFRFTNQIIHDLQYCVDYGAIICSHFIRNRGVWTSKKEGVNIISKNSGVDLAIDYDAIGYPVYSTIEELPASATDGDLNRVYDETTEYKWYQYSEADSSWNLCIDEQGDERYPVGGVGDKDFRIAMQKAFANWLIAQDEAGTPLTIWYESTDTSNYEEIDISEYQDWDALERFILSRGTNSITADTSISPLSINVEYYGDKYIEE